ncbi:MAG: hypothetical protein ACI9MC_000304, partial [Kiritimatiellia bacterium]
EVPPTFTRKSERWDVMVQTSDGSKESEETSASTTVANSAPTVELGWVDAEPSASDDLVLLVSPNDPDFDELSVELSWTVDGAASSNVGETVPASATLRGQRWIATATVSDGEAAPVVAEARVDVANSAPRVYALSMSPEPLRTDDNTKVSYSAEDADGDSIITTQQWLVNDVLTDFSSQTLPASQYQRGDEVKVGVSANDGFVEGDIAWFSAVVANTPAVVAGVALNPRVVDESVEVGCMGVDWHDSDGDDERYLITWYVNDVAIGTGATLTGADFERDDRVRCTLIPWDGHDEGAEWASETVTVDNAPPTLASLSIGPADPVKDDVIKATYGATEDLDGDPVELSHEWKVNGTLVSGATTLDSSWFKHNDTVQLLVRPVDGLSHGAPVSSNELTGANNLPEIVSVTLTGGDVFTDDVIEATVIAADFDAEKVTLAYTWYADGKLVSGPTAEFLDGTLYFAKDQVISLLVTPSDPTGPGKSATSSKLTVSNSPPEAPLVYIDPPAPEPDEALGCKIDKSSYDADADSVTYTFKWYDDEVLSSKGSTTSHTNDTIAAKHRYDDDAWSCEVVPNDGDDDGDSGWAYPHSNGPWTFTSCAQDGQSGPSQSQCDSEYKGAPLEDRVTVAAGVQTFVAPAPGTYRIEAWGAQGESAQSGRFGGKGARIRGDLKLLRGQKIQILVGQQGESDGCSAGGGGGSFVLDGTGKVLIVAGGGGGTRTAVSQNGCDGRVSGFAGTGSRSAITWSCAAKTTDLGSGGLISSGSWGSAGGGLNSNGKGEYLSGNGGVAPKNGGTGGGAGSYKAFGGFGGGGAGNGKCGGGGGGGYSGGDGGRIAGGAGSHNSGTSKSESAGVQSGHGKVVIERL